MILWIKAVIISHRESIESQSDSSGKHIWNSYVSVTYYSFADLSTVQTQFF